jgi:hypothetical protein
MLRTRACFTGLQRILIYRMVKCKGPTACSELRMRSGAERYRNVVMLSE